MSLRLLLTIALLSLIVGCAHFTPADSKGSDSPESDLTALASNAKQDLAPRTLPSGKMYCAEEAKVQKTQDQCLGDQEDLSLAAETDKAVGLANILKAVEEIKLRLNPCGWLSRTLFHRDRCRSKISD
jgi:hypothetical protein